MASNVVNLIFVELDCFIALLFALLSLWWSSILLNLFFVSWFVLLKFVLLFWFDFENGSFVLLCLIYCLRFLIIVEIWSPGAVLPMCLFFSAFDFGVFCSMVCVVEVCLVVFVWLWKWGLLFCCVWFMVCVFLFCRSLISWGCFAYWFVISYCVEDFICALCWVLLIKEVYFLIEMTAHFKMLE